MPAEFTVTIEQFEGPLDLMLHLIKEKKLDLFDLDLSVLADQYIDYIRAMEDLHLEIAGEYLAEMANLIEYKSKRLLPRDNSELEDNYEEDTRGQLIQRLLEYQRFKEVTATFAQLSEQRSMQFDKPESDIANFYRRQNSDDLPAEGGNMADLLRAMNQCIRRYQIMQPMPVSSMRKEISQEERAEQLTAIIDTLPEEFTMDDLMEGSQDMYLLIVTFLAVLDMMKGRMLVASVRNDEIFLKRGAEYGLS